MTIFARLGAVTREDEGRVGEGSNERENDDGGGRESGGGRNRYK